MSFPIPSIKTIFVPNKDSLMHLIKSDETLRKFLPNILTTVQGEASLFEKLSPWLHTTELWLSQKILSLPTLMAIAEAPYSDEYHLAATFEVYSAFCQAIPSLDLILTPNGFGIVSNQNVVPASKERVERLILQLQNTADTALESLLNLLPGRADWQDSKPYLYWGNTLFPNISIAREVITKGTTGSLYEQYFRLRPQIIAIEVQIADEFLSPELLIRFRHMLVDCPSQLTAPEKRVISQVRSEIASILNGMTPNREHLVSIVNYIRHHPNDFIAWHTSATAQLFSPPVFQNKKESKGYWF